MCKSQVILAVKLTANHQQFTVFLKITGSNLKKRLHL